MQLQLYLVLLFYHVVLEELVAIGTGAKPSFSCLHIFFFFNLDPRPFSLHLARNTSSNECLRPSNGWSQAPGTFSDELERLKNLYLYAHRTVQEPMHFCASDMSISRTRTYHPSRSDSAS